VSLKALSTILKLILKLILVLLSNINIVGEGALSQLREVD